LSEKTEELREAAHTALKNPVMLAKIAEALKGSSRRARQRAANVLAIAAHMQPEKLEPYIGDMVDALNRPEAQTRWECLEALVMMVPIDSRQCDRAFDGAEAALFDEDNGLLRLGAVRFLAKLGATTEKRSEKVWPLLDEAIQCYHGDPEFQEMLAAIIEFSEGKLANQVKEQLKDRMTFDAENGKGALKARASQIVENLS
jgi:hypothetical protein